MKRSCHSHPQTLRWFLGNAIIDTAALLVCRPIAATATTATTTAATSTTDVVTIITSGITANGCCRCCTLACNNGGRQSRRSQQQVCWKHEQKNGDGNVLVARRKVGHLWVRTEVPQVPNGVCSNSVRPEQCDAQLIGESVKEAVHDELDRVAGAVDEDERPEVLVNDAPGCADQVKDGQADSRGGRRGHFFSRKRRLHVLQDEAMNNIEMKG